MFNSFSLRLVTNFLLLTQIFGRPEVRSQPVVYLNVTNQGDSVTRNCDDNEIYIVDGERTLVITSGKMARDLDHIQVEEAVLAL